MTIFDANIISPQIVGLKKSTNYNDNCSMAEAAVAKFNPDVILWTQCPK